MAKHSARRISKKYLPKGLVRKTINGERMWVLGDKQWKTLRSVVIDLRSLIAEEIQKMIKE